MESKVFGLLAGPPWHLRGSGPEYTSTGAAAAALRGKLTTPIRRPLVRRPRPLVQCFGYEALLGCAFARVSLMQCLTVSRACAFCPLR
eukprot:9764224-Alexandrium_andersonii.AAC.1